MGFVKKEVSKNYDVSVVPSREFIEFVFEPEYWFSQIQKVKKGLLKHELLHLVYKHPLRAREYAIKNIFYLASDLVVNQNLQSDELPPNAFSLEFLTNYGVHFETNKDVDYYYKKLLEFYEDLLFIKPNLCSICEEKEESSEKTKASEQLEILDILEERTFCNAHNTWRSFDEDIGAKNGIIEYNLNHLFVSIHNKMTVNNSWGSVSDGLRSYLGDIALYKAEQVNWKKALKIFVASSQKTYLKNTISRVSKRYGTTPGIKIKRRSKLCVVIDTSGSLSDSELTEYFHEIFHIWKQNVEIMIVECDVEIQRTYEYKGKMPKFAQGRGGTSFNAPISYNNDDFKGDALIYFTDGMAESPKVKSRVPIFWLIYNKKELTNELDGRVVFMRN